MNEKLKIDIYKGLPMVIEKINTVALAAVVGKTDAWMYQKMRKSIVKGMQKEFKEEDLPLMNGAVEALGAEIASCMVEYKEDRDEVIAQIRELRKLVSLPYIYTEILKVKKGWFESRMRARSKEGKACSFKEDDVMRINMAVMQIANELKSIEFVLK